MNYALISRKSSLTPKVLILPDVNIRTAMLAAFCQADSEWIQGQMLRLRPSMRNKVAVLYAEVYDQHYQGEPVSFRKENRARHEANTRLRVYVQRYADAAAGLTEKPPLASTKAQAGFAAGNGNDQQDSGWRNDAGISDDAIQGNVSLASEKTVRFSQDQNPQKSGQVQRLIESSNHQAPE